MKEHSEPSKEEQKRLLIEMMKEDEKNGMYDTDRLVSDWLTSVTPEMYQAVSAIRELIRHTDGTKGKMLIANVIEQYIASQFKKGDQTEQRFTIEDMKSCWKASEDSWEYDQMIGWMQNYKFDEWIKTL